MKKYKGPKYVQLKNPKTGKYVKINRHEGIIVGSKKTPYKNIPGGQILHANKVSGKEREYVMNKILQGFAIGGFLVFIALLCMLRLFSFVAFVFFGTGILLVDVINQKIFGKNNSIF